MLANEGHHSGLRFLKSEKTMFMEKKPLLSPEAAYLILDILSSNPRPDQSYNNTWVRDSIPVAWKTGTSHGFRDAWSVGVFGPYVLAVWLGNFNGTANPNLIGRDAAGPLFFRIVDAIRSLDPLMSEYPNPIKPSAVTRVKVCALSGQLPGKHCHDQVNTLYLPGKSPIKTCEIHRSFKVSQKTGLRICDSYSRGDAKEEVFEIWPSDILKLFKRAGLPRRLPPAFEKGCGLNANPVQGKPPAITSPKSEMTYLFRFGDRAPSSGDDTISLSANTDGDVQYLHWFINNEYLGKTTHDKPLFWKIRQGHFVVRTVDEQGRSDSKRFNVESSE
jgi:penicillin-binding protein 1C